MGSTVLAGLCTENHGDVTECRNEQPTPDNLYRGSITNNDARNFFGGDNPNGLKSF